MHCHNSITDTLDSVKIACANEQRKGHFEKFESGYALAEWKMSPTTCRNAPPPLTGRLQCRRILGGRKLLVYVCTVVTAIFDVMSEED